MVLSLLFKSFNLQISLPSVFLSIKFVEEIRLFFFSPLVEIIWMCCVFVCIYLFGHVCLCVQMGKPERTRGALLLCFPLYPFEIGSHPFFIFWLGRLVSQLWGSALSVFSPISMGLSHACRVTCGSHLGAGGLNSYPQAQAAALTLTH